MGSSTSVASARVDDTGNAMLQNSVSHYPATPALATRQRSQEGPSTVEFAGMLVSSTDVEALLSQVAGQDGEVSVPTLKRSLESNGLMATTLEVEEMIKMLNPPREPESIDTSSARVEPDTANGPFPRFAPALNSPVPTSPVIPSMNSVEIVRDTLWQAFLNRSFVVGEAMLNQGILERDAIQQREAFVFVALPSLTFLDVITSAGRVDDTLSFGGGVSVSPTNAPAEWRPIIEAIIRARDLLHASNDSTLVCRLRLSCAADPDEGYAFDGAEDETLTRIRGQLQSAATATTQTDRFKENYESVFELITIVTQ